MVYFSDRLTAVGVCLRLKNRLKLMGSRVPGIILPGLGRRGDRVVGVMLPVQTRPRPGAEPAAGAAGRAMPSLGVPKPS